MIFEQAVGLALKLEGLLLGIYSGGKLGLLVLKVLEGLLVLCRVNCLGYAAILVLGGFGV